MDGLDVIVDAAWTAYDHADGELPSLVRPSIPIAWFGDLEAYLRSPLRVISVGLNPSGKEFPEDDRFERFPNSRHLNGRPDGDGGQAGYVASLNDYFRERPYTAWFGSSYEQVLLGMGASFFGGAENAAIHTDLFSPLATSPTWSQLGNAERAALRDDGVRLWHDLVRFLEPHVILASVARRNLDDVGFAPAGNWRHVVTIERKNPYVVDARGLRVSARHAATLVFGRAAQTPFGSVSREDKRRIGRAVLGSLDGR